MEGQGSQTWVLLRGLTRESAHWGDFPARLLRALRIQQPQAQLELLDLPGNGDKHRQSSPTHVEDMMEDCRAELRRRGVPPPYQLLAMSLGAMVASEWAAQYPEELTAIVLINTSLRPFSAFFRRLRPSNYWALLMLSLTRLSLRQREAKVLSMTTRLQQQPDRVIEDWVSIQRRHPVRKRNALRQLLAAARYRASVAKPEPPMLLLCSQGDALVDWRCSQAISRAWGAPLRLHARAGHDLPLDDGEWVARNVADWLHVREVVGQVTAPMPL
ncbi:MAG: alpha/beta hydrolase [Mitsuaria chitosanitabida]|jgi:pimeloyl-ACP methyl ester carboxylesterase|uniref:alpha/beta fold hydrolase n=1 Tax=Roseateles chitosanitabidus TaxID=65048 RepID=UPI001B1B3CEA|nr:alpha/beta hydrolase [Roseateles chitosanitabidus]MBO9686372.1 alpha/beta hydrolase [Roseateles chitosanitabidus]